jgi:Protein of unknown function (DUF4242)
MPTFMDFHDDLKLPDEAVRQITKETEEGKVDKFGVRQKVYCLLDAPDEEAVRRHHAALGIACGDVHEVKSLL